MKLTVRQLKSLLREALAPPPARRAAQLVSSTVNAATRYVDSLVAGSPDRRSASELEDLIDQTSSMAKWMTSHREPLSPSMVRFAQLAADVGQDVGFWKRPVFFGRDDYLEKIKSKVKKLQGAQIDIVTKSN
jgi:hypothetical protein